MTRVKFICKHCNGELVLRRSTGKIWSFEHSWVKDSVRCVGVKNELAFCDKPFPTWGLGGD